MEECIIRTLKEYDGYFLSAKTIANYSELPFNEVEQELHKLAVENKIRRRFELRGVCFAHIK